MIINLVFILKFNRRRGFVLDIILKVEGLRSRRGKIFIELVMEFKVKREILLVGYYKIIKIYFY